MAQSPLEQTFITRWLQLAPAYPEPESEYLFWTGRKWRFDFCFPDYAIAVELEGIGSATSRHTSFTGYTADCEKYNHAVIAGYKVLRFTSKMLDNDPDGCINMIKLLIDRQDMK